MGPEEKRTYRPLGAFCLLFTAVPYCQQHWSESIADSRIGILLRWTNLDYMVALSFFFGLLLVYVLVRILYLPVRWLFLILYNGVLGGVALWVLNLLVDPLGLQVALNPFTALIAGFLGIPGIVVLIIFSYLVS